jgi:hypothetical protein
MSMNNIWRVTFDSTFSSSSGMEKYSKKEPTKTVIVATAGDSLSDVETAVKSGLDNQTRLDALISAEWLGRLFGAA